MLAVVKAPHTEISLTGQGAQAVLTWLSKKFNVKVVSPDMTENETVDIEDTEFWTEMNRNRVGNLLEAARLKAGLSQEQLADAVKIRQNMVSEYENGRRRLTRRMARRIAEVLKVKPERFFKR